MNISQPLKDKEIDISVIIPVYGCDKSLPKLYERLTASLESIVKKYEIILIDDCDPGNTWEIIQSIAKIDGSVKGIRLSRNFGQHIAITAGLEESIGSWVVVMDCDLQDKPEEIVKLYEKAQSGVDIVFAQRVDRQDSFFKKSASKLFYRVLGYLTETKLDYSVANFGIYDRKVINAVLSMKEVHKFFPVMVRWVGFSSASIKVSHADRIYGDTVYTLRSLIALSFGVMLSFSDKPLRLIVKFGFIVSFVSAIYALSIVIDVLLNGATVAGWSSMMASLWLIFGILMSIVGVVGLYVGRTFDETKCRPVYIIKDITSKNI
ncbi:MAG: glycosyltransferase family 2 protein [Candidatus Marinimicrobia bacterium]|nr:glycosyltransferase family 2 protein [Candidatus Neomarinimicrobiota bacterium]